jgi:hypothetical protein
MDELRFTHELLGEEGMTKYGLQRARRDGELQQVRRGVYAGADDLDDRSRHLRLIRATVPLAGPSSVVSHASAGVLHGLPVPVKSLDRVWATREAGGHGRHGSVLHLRRCRLAGDEVTIVDGIPVTTLERTVIDLARLLAFEWGVMACDAALASGLNREALLTAAARASGWPGARKAVAAAVFADGASQSPLESVSRVQLHRLGFPTPSLQLPVVSGGKVVATCDFGWEEVGLVGECDGKFKYGRLLRPGESPDDAVMREKRREERIRGAGFWIVRWGWEEAWNPGALRGIVEKGFTLAPRSRGRTRAG